MPSIIFKATFCCGLAPIRSLVPSPAEFPLPTIRSQYQQRGAAPGFWGSGISGNHPARRLEG